MKNINFDNGIKFECQGSSNCCVSRESYGYVYLSKKDVNRFSSFMKLKITDFIKLYCEKTDGFLHLKESLKNKNCQFLNNKKCTVYKARPTQCRTWPFWRENMNAKTWNKEISKFCPGIGKGNKISKNKIDKSIELDLKNELDILKENR
ncbi:YkgJ family cysteine cluster protein [Alphaproteobacteria bacterium]|nr:YkgJ family cysteine cluster protein [Alphaproteobacteria bacterium]